MIMVISGGHYESGVLVLVKFPRKFATGGDFLGHSSAESCSYRTNWDW